MRPGIARPDSPPSSAPSFRGALLWILTPAPARSRPVENTWKTGDYSFTGRIKYWPCRRGVLPPSFWNPAVAERSARLPEQGLSLEFVHGYGGRSNTAPNLFYLANGNIVYYVAGVAIVYNKLTHEQHYFFGHDDDIACLAIHPNRTWVATGQVASTRECPMLCIWDSTVAKDRCVRCFSRACTISCPYRHSLPQRQALALPCRPSLSPPHPPKLAQTPPPVIPAARAW